MEELNILIVENSPDAITNAKTAFKHSFKQLNELAKLGIDINIFPQDGKENNFSNRLIKYIKDSEKFDDYNLVTDYLKEQFEDFKINVLLLDFLLSHDEEKRYGDKNERIDDSSGAKILQLIRKSKYKSMPCLGYTQLKDHVKELKMPFPGPLFQIDKDFMGKNYFIENQGHLHNMLTEARKYQNEIENQCDIIVVCALKKEIKPVIELLNSEKYEDKSDTFGIGYITNKDDVKLKVVAISREQMGMAEAATLTTQMIEKYNPLYVVMTGIAGGVDAEGQKFLDILMPSHIHNWQSGKYKVKIDKKEEEKILHVFDRDYSSVGTYIKENSTLCIDMDYLKNLPEEFLKSEGFKGQFERRNIQNFIKQALETKEKNRSEFKKEIIKLYKAEEEMKNLQNSEQQDNELKIKNIKNKFTQQNSVVDTLFNMANSLECEIRKDAMVSGSAVVSDGKIVNTQIKERKVNGIDMEAYGVVYACNHSKKKPKVIILKAICDFADANKNDIYQSAAAYVSAHVFYELFSNHIKIKE